MKISCIYIIRSKIKPGESYVGSAFDFCKRKKRHLYSLSQKDHCNVHLQRHVDKYGIDDIYFEILKRVFDTNIILSEEQKYIELLNPSFNMCLVAGNCSGRKFSQETKNKISAAHKGKQISDTHRQNLIKSHLGNRPSKETLEKMSISRRKWKISEEAKQKIRETNTGVKFSDERKKKISVALSGKKRKPLSEDHKEKIRIRHTGRVISLEARIKISNSLKGNKLSKESIIKREATRKANRLLKLTA